MAEAKKKLSQQFREWLVFHHYSPRTVETYIGCVRSFVAWSGKRDPLTMGAKEVNDFLSHLANNLHVTAKTQTQNLCALVRFYDGCLGKPLGDIGKFAYASTPSRLPVVMSKGEVFQVIETIPPNALRLMAKLLYGCGLRLMECCRLRVKDLDFERMVLNVRGGKGEKDRNVPLPESIIAELKAHLEYNHARCLREKWVVHLPDALVRKYPSYETDWQWQYVFAAKIFSTDPDDGRQKIHHIHENSLQKAVHTAVRKLGMTKRVTCHTLRHSFATHLLEANVPLTDIQKLLGHSKLETTGIYIHVAMPIEKRVKSPLDSRS